jgi:hypothetical protein
MKIIFNFGFGIRTKKYYSKSRTLASTNLRQYELTALLLSNVCLLHFDEDYDKVKFYFRVHPVLTKNILPKLLKWMKRVAVRPRLRRRRPTS